MTAPAKACRECGVTLSSKAKGDLCRSHRMKALHKDPEFAARNKARNSARMKALHKDPEFAARHSARMKALHADPVFAERRDARMKALHADPVFAERRDARMKALRADPKHNPLVLLTPAERAGYDVLRRARYARAEALRAIGRADLVREAAE